MKTREILFRGLRTDGKGWVYGVPVYDTKNTYIISGVIQSNDQFITIEQWQPVTPESVSQFTGLLDKNGTRIFEGDMFTHYYYGLCVVIFNGGSFKAQSKKQNKTVGFGSWSKQILVVGNIHEQ